MVFADTPQPPDSPEKDVNISREGIFNLEGVQDLIGNLKKGDWASMVGGILTLWKEYFGTPEEKEEIRRVRKERADAETQKRTQQRLQTLRSDVDAGKDAPRKSDEPQEATDEELVHYKPGDVPPHVSDKSVFRSRVEQIYARQDTIFTVNNLREYFGQNYKKFLINKDPVTKEEPITFLGRPILGGVNLMMLPFLKIAEKKIFDLHLNYVPKENAILGFQDRNMCTGTTEDGKEILDPNVPSFHKYALAVDVDHSFNWPKNGRGTIPDEVIIAMAESGFACGSIANPSFSYLMNDTMHYQLRFPPDSAAGQEIINASPVGIRYWNAIRPMLEAVKNVA